MKEYVDTPTYMGYATQQRSRKYILGLLTLLLTYQIYRAHGPITAPVPFAPVPPPPCDQTSFPAIPEPPPQAIEAWNQLRELFDAHQPNVELEHADFEGGQTVKPTVELLDQFLDLTSAEAKEMQDEHAQVVRNIPPYPDGQFRGKGIVIIAGGKYSEYASTTLGMIRLLGGRLPVEVWMKDRNEEQQGWCEELASQGMACRFVEDYIDDMSPFTHHYQLKTPVILLSSFSEILFLDSDSFPVVNPDRVFDAPAYRLLGAVLWPDYWGTTESPWTPYITGAKKKKDLTRPTYQTVDSGQMMWNKEMHWQTLALAAYYNYYGPQYFYTLITQGGPGWGDKDTFPTALRALSAPWHFVPHKLETQRYDGGRGYGIGTGMAMLQADPRYDNKQRPMFLHSNFVKMSARRLMCGTCVEDESALSEKQRENGEDVEFDGRVIMRKDPVWEMLNFSKRIFATRIQIENEKEKKEKKEEKRKKEKEVEEGVDDEDDEKGNEKKEQEEKTKKAGSNKSSKSKNKGTGQGGDKEEDNSEDGVEEEEGQAKLKTQSLSRSRAILQRKPPLKSDSNIQVLEQQDKEPFELNWMGRLNTERDIWRVLERSACEGVWSEERLCRRTRRHLDLTFGKMERWRGECVGSMEG
ncbi:MAG: hypothetical protein LQ351_004026 [Letrouitia transgressa]|nr:MAG: hypothetical protein LQ351_004026 [Letrouitia transgressa]